MVRKDSARHAGERNTAGSNCNGRPAVRCSRPVELEADLRGKTSGHLRIGPSGCPELSHRRLGRAAGRRGGTHVRDQGADVRGHASARRCRDQRGYVPHHDDVEGRTTSHVRSGQSRPRSDLPGKPAAARAPGDLERPGRPGSHAPGTGRMIVAPKLAALGHRRKTFGQGGQIFDWLAIHPKLVRRPNLAHHRLRQRSGMSPAAGLGG